MKYQGLNHQTLDNYGFPLKVGGLSFTKNRFVLALLCITSVCAVWFFSSLKKVTSDIETKHVRTKLPIVCDDNVEFFSKKIFPFTNELTSFPEVMTMCYRGQSPESIEDLNKFVMLLKISEMPICQQMYELFSELYRIRVKYTTVVISDSFLLKVKKWVNNDKKLIRGTQNQSVIFIDNLYTLESVVFNPVRSNRPGVASNGAEKYIKDIVHDTGLNCDFCNYANSTASDTFGYMKSERSVVISNTFKIDKYHGMVLFKKHNPVQIEELQYIDSMALALKWFNKTHSLSPDHKYRYMYMDILPKASASQIHPHVHLTLGDGGYYSKWNKLHRSALLYSHEHQNTNYWTNVLEVHNALGLVVSFGKASVMAYLTPQKDFEVVVISRRPCLDFFRLVYFTLQTFLVDLKEYSLSMGYVFPKLDKQLDDGEKLPMMLRIISRGPVDNPRSDVTSFDLFGTPNVNKDPFKVVNSIRKSVEERSKEPLNFPNWIDE